jgi:AcrR family transcriptional regulator
MARALDQSSERPEMAHRGGRPRSALAERAILEATRDLLAEGGVGQLTVEGVAARARVAKTTIYRRYRSKYELALAVLIDMVEQMGGVPDLGDTRRELVAFVGGAIRVLDGTLMGRVMQGLVSDLAAEPDLAAAFRAGAVARRRRAFGEILARAIERGDLRPDTDRELAYELLFGPVYYRFMLSGRPLDPRLPERVADALLAAFAPAPRASPRRPRRSARAAG